MNYQTIIDNQIKKLEVKTTIYLKNKNKSRRNQVEVLKGNIYKKICGCLLCKKKSQIQKVKTEFLKDNFLRY